MSGKKIKVRADELMIRAGHAADLTAARAAIMAGGVFVEGPNGGQKRVEKPGETYDASAVLAVSKPAHPYVSRGGVKLAGALDHFAIDPRGLTCADFGSSTGGFTDCLLQRGAARVYAVDVGYGQLAWKLRGDPRVVLFERTNVRHLPQDFFGERVALAAIDLSFIGLGSVLAAIAGQLAERAEVIALVKPQFELPPEDVPAGGVVLDPGARRRAVGGVCEAAKSAGFEVRGEVESPIKGADGNVEILLRLEFVR